jgi:hypothetical protein
MKMVRYGSVFVLTLLLMSSAAIGQILTFEFSALAGSEVSAASNFNDANLTSSTITRGSGVTASGNTQRFNSTGWTTGTVDLTDYVEFTITPNSGKKFSITSVVMQHQRSATGPTAFAIRSSVDSYAADLATATGTDVTTTQSATFTFAQSDLTTATTYRIYAYSAEAGTGTWGPGDGTGNDITVNGSTADLTVSEPTTAATSVSFSSVGAAQFTVNWTNGNGASRLVLVKSGGAVDDVPVDNTSYTASTTFGSGTQIGTGNYVVYASTGNSVTVSGLSASTTYHISVFEFNGTGATANFLTTTPGTGNQSTSAAVSSASDIATSNNETNNIDYAAKQVADITATSDGVRVWSFTIRDGGGSADADAFGTELNSITIGKGGSNTVTSWTNTVRRAALYDGSTEIAEVDVAGETISFTGLSGAGVTATDDGSKTLDIYFTFETAVTDNQQFHFLVTAATENPAMSQFAAADAGAAASSVTGDANKIEVTATVIGFVQQPTSVGTGNSITPAVTVEAKDANGRRDLDYATDVTITATGATLTGSPVSATPVSGLATFSTLSLSTAGSGVTLTGASGSFSNITSSAFDVFVPLTQNAVMITHLSADYTGSSDEFIVVFNNSSASVDLNGYELKYFSSSGGAGSAGVQFTASTVIPARSYLLLSPNATVSIGSVNVARDYSFTAGLGASGQIVLREISNTTNIIFAVAWGTITGYTASMTDAASWPADGMIHLTTSGLTYTRTNYNSSNTQYTHVVAASIASLPNSSTPALPVELTSFTAVAKGRGVELSWSTATEQDNLGFEVERKSGGEWTRLGFVKGAGTTNAPQSYTFTDASAKGSVAYRLKQIDRDGGFEYTGQVEVFVEQIVTTYALTQNYPNPFNPSTTIQYQIPVSGNVSLKVYDMLGKEVAAPVNGFHPAGVHAVSFDASQLSSGIYFYQLRSGSFLQTRRMQLLK